MIHKESHLQQACVKWFRLQYPTIANLLFAVPNGGARSRTEAAIMKGEGVTAGVADLLLLIARGGFGSLAIEMKDDRKSSKQRPSQIQWQQSAEQAGNKYEIVRTFEDFQNVVNAYLSEPATNPERQNRNLYRAVICSPRQGWEEYVYRHSDQRIADIKKFADDVENGRIKIETEPKICKPSGMCQICMRSRIDIDKGGIYCNVTGEHIYSRGCPEQICGYFLKTK